MKNKLVKILAGILAFSIFAFILYLANGLIGNPISSFLARRTVEKYISTTYHDLNLIIEKVSFNFKNNDYNVYLKSADSIDTHFSVSVSPVGQINYDYYESAVANRFNTYIRIDREYATKVENLLTSPAFDYSSYINYGTLQIYEKSSSYGLTYGINIDDLVLDQNYDVMKLGKTCGKLVLYIDDETVTFEQASKILLNIKKLFDTNDITFYAIDFTLEKTRIDDKPNADNESISVGDFLYEDIYEENLTERLIKANQDLENYYMEQDKIKDSYIEKE